ncbi:CRAL/TRIO, N-terminal domain,CRAL-TRIO lipid binding domain [Cinara cedri]|uniref:CRAL/TRIO, N-terminal domain,CRAL-TRIO lipid binding domain n=1 Tax=Cinara cedri TaxID=506608 RepID=A0A5E4N5Q9_9HEMI|nr:CRAL/TRIO, N-terminal domain,CRAL-TRIO lipid binding domain [Cinara cedri]
MPSELNKIITMNDEQLISKVGKNNVEIIKEWLLKQPHLPEISDKQLVIFLNCCRCNVENAKKMIDSYYTMRTQTPEMFANRKISEFYKTIDLFYFQKMPVQPNGYRLGFSRLRDFNSNVFNTLDTIRLVFAMCDICINEDPVVPGWKLVMDMTGFSIGHLTKLTNLTIMKKCLHYIQAALPMRLIAVHMINAPSVVNQLLMFLKPLMQRELYSLISVHTMSDMDTVYKSIPQEYFPSDMGGKSPSLEVLKDEAKQLLKSYEKFFEDDDEFNRVDENKRIDKNRFNSSSYGLEGSFKKIEFD